MDAEKMEKSLIVTVSGRMDALSAPEFEKKVGGWMDEGETNFIIDLGMLDYISSAGLRSMLILTKELKAKDRQLLLAALKDTVQEVFEISGFSSIIPICKSVEAAIKQI